MKLKTLLGALLLLSVTFTNCTESGGSGDGTTGSVMQGLTIYDLAVQQNTLALLPANTGVRLAILLAEAEKQRAAGQDVDIQTMEVNKVNVKDALFGAQSTIEVLEGGDYRVTYGPTVVLAGFSLSGSLLVHTGDIPFSETNMGRMWSVDTEGVKASMRTSVAQSTILYNGGKTTLHMMVDTYQINVQDADLRVDGSAVRSSWSGMFVLQGETSSLAYSDCKGRTFTGSATFSGPSYFSLPENGLSTGLTYRLMNAVYRDAGTNFTGKVTAGLMNNYNPEVYPSPTVTCTFAYDYDKKRYMTTVEYNGYTATF